MIMIISAITSLIKTLSRNRSKRTLIVIVIVIILFHFILVTFFFREKAPFTEEVKLDHHIF